MGSIARNSVIVTAFNVAGTALIFFSNLVIAYKFGAGREMDIYFASTTLPFFVMTVLSLAINFTFIPVLSQLDKEQSPERWNVVSGFMNLNLIFTVLVSAACMLFSLRIMAVITPGFTQDKLESSAALMAVFFPAVVLNTLNELLSCVYYTRGRFVIPSLNKILNPVFTILCVAVFGSSLNVASLVLAILGAFLTQSVFLIARIRRGRDFHYRFTADPRHPGLAGIFRLMLPLAASMLITKAMSVTDKFFLSPLQDGSISYVEYAFRITLRLTETVASGLIVAIFPAMALHASSLNYERLYISMAKGVKMLFFITVPCALISAVYGKPILRFLLERGSFTRQATDATFPAFALYMLSLPSDMARSVFYKGFYSLNKQKVVAVISVLNMVCYLALSALFINILKYLAMPFSYLIAFHFATFASAFLFGRSIKRGFSREIAAELAKNIGASAPALLYIWLITARMTNPVTYILACASGFLVYFLFSHAVFRSSSSLIVWGHLTSFKKFLRRT
jgi:putative peptidoglycan lipid II flippase